VSIETAPTPNILVVTSAGAAPGAIVPVLAAIEAGGMRVRAIDVGGAGGGGVAISDRVRRALLGETAERRLRKELEANPPDVAIAFDPYAAQALTVARDQVAAPAPVIGIVGELEPEKAWAQTDCDRLLASDADAAVSLADAGVEPDRILVVGAFGERAFADAGAEDRTAIRTRYGLVGTVIAIEVTGLGGEVTGQIALQLSLWSAADKATFLFDAAGDPDAAAVLRKQVPMLGLRAKLFGSTGDAALFYRAAEVIVARPRPHAIARAALVGARLIALVDDSVPGGARAAAALEARRRGSAIKTPLLLSSAIDALAGARALDAQPDGADATADVLFVIANDKRAVVEERRAAARAQTADKLRSATAAASAAARTTAMPGELEDLGGGPSPGPAAPPPPSPPSRDEVQRLRAETRLRLDQLNKSMMAARTDATDAEQKASHARGRGDDGSAQIFQRKADAERARMHGLLREMATLESELAQLEKAAKDAEASGATSAEAPRPDSAPSASAPPRRPPPAAPEDPLADLKRKAGAGRKAAEKTVEDELAALKRKMEEKKKSGR
jgi:Monogalactosyldiacylglycerol (MGDG) synthase